MKKLVIVCAACLITITAILLHHTWSEHRRAREAEAALTHIEANKPPQFETTIPPEGTGSATDPSQQLVVSVDDRGVLTLNSQDAGTVDDLSRLHAQLKQALKESGGLRPGRTVFVKASPRLKYTEVKSVVDAVKDSGAAPVGLQIDDPK